MNRIKTVLFIIIMLSVTHFFIGCSEEQKWELETEQAEIANLIVESVLPSDVIVGEAVLDRESRVVTIPMIKGLAQFPLTLSVHITLRINTKEVVPGATFTSFDQIVFDLPENGGPMSHKFYAVAKDDSQREYTILLDIAEGADIEALSINNDYLPSDAEVVVEMAHINSKKGRISIVALNTTYPLTINVTPTLSTGATMKSAPPAGVDYTGGEMELKFESANSPLKYIVESDRGIIKEWSVELIEGVETPSSNVKALMFNTEQMQVTIPNIIGANVPYTKTNTGSSTLTLYIDSAGVGVSSGVDIVIEQGLRPTSIVVGQPLTQTTQMSYTEYDTPQKVVVVDLLKGEYRKWSVEISNALDMTDILDFEFSYSDPQTPTYIEFKKEVKIDNVGATITLVATTSSLNQDYWPVVVTPTKVELTMGATSDINTMSFGERAETKSFTVTSQTGKTREWSVNIVRDGQ